MKMLLMLMLMLTGFVNPPESEKVRIKNFELEIPEELEKVVPKEKYNELLSLRYKKELKILITDDIGSPDKTAERKKNYEAFDMITTSFNIKFLKWYNTFNGYEKGELKKDKINSFKARTRDFKAKINDEIYYFEINTINIGNYYFDLIITGKEDKRSSHQAIVSELVSSIKKISEN